MGKINLTVALRTLTNKKCKIYKTIDHAVDVIDVSSAEELGNKSWGYLDYLRSVGYSIIGMDKLQASNASFYPSKESKLPKTRSSAPIEIDKENWHSYANIIVNKESKSEVSELTHLKMLNHFQSKFDRSVFKKSRIENKDIKKIKKSLDIPFSNTKIWSSDFEKVTDIPTNRK